MSLTIPQETKLFDDLFTRVSDLADNRGKRYSLFQILSLDTIGLLQGANDFVNIEKTLKQNEETLKQVFDLDRLPSHDTLGDRLNEINPEEFMTLFSRWAQDLVPEKKHVVIDGKVLRGSALSSKGENAPVIVDCIDAETQLCIGAGYVDCKRSEMSVAPEVLKRLDLSGCAVGGDAAMSTPRIRKALAKDKAYFVLPVKKNRGKTYQDIIDSFEEIFQTEELKRTVNQICPEGTVVRAFYEEKDYSYIHTEEKGHGRSESRDYYLLNNLENFPIEGAKDAKAIALVVRRRKEAIPCKGRGNKKLSPEQKVIIKESCEVVPFILNFNPTVEELKEIIRREWRIENGLHYPLDMTFGEDRSTIRRPAVRLAMAILRRIAYNLLILAKSTEKKESFQGKRIVLTFHFFLALRLVLGDISKRKEEFYRVYLKQEREKIKNDLDIFVFE